MDTVSTDIVIDNRASNRTYLSRRKNHKTNIGVHPHIRIKQSRPHQIRALHQTGGAPVWWRPHQAGALTKPEKLSTKPEPTKPEEPRFGDDLTKIKLSPNRRSPGLVAVSPSRSSSPSRSPPNRKSSGLVAASPKSSSHQTGEALHQTGAHQTGGASVWWRSHQAGAPHQAGAYQAGGAPVW